MRTESAQDGLQISLLGELEIVVGGSVLALPPSKKTRALLGYLALSDRPHRRERLCELLWDVADDPRAALRWSLSKLRELVDGQGVKRLGADREHVWLDLRHAYVDVLALKSLFAGSIDDQSTAALEAARALFRGELLEGLDLPDFHAYYAWCVAERKLWRDRHRQVLETLLRRTGGQLDKALPLVRELVHLDPLDEGARAQLLELLHATGKIREAEEQSRANRRLLSEAPPSEQAEPGANVSAEVPLRRSVSHDEVLFVGRKSERERIRTSLAREAPGVRALLIVGEAGVGKSRLVRELAREAASAGARVVSACASEVGPGSSYAPWLELLTALGAENVDASLREGLVPLWSNASVRAAAPDGREPLFRASASILERAAGEAGRLMLVIEDVHWLDDASAELLYFVARMLRNVRVDVFLTARPGELHERPQVARVLRTLRREGLLEEVALPVLTREETFALIAPLSEPSLREHIYRQSAGNPLFALELAREVKSDADALPRSISRLVRERLEALSPEQVDVLRWASVLGSHFDVDLLAQLVAPTPDVLVEKLEQLERLGWVSLPAAPSGSGNPGAFSHAIVRSSVYDQLSEPRRRLMHAKVSRLLGARSDAEGPGAAVVAHHAALGGDRATAARACLAAAKRSCRVFAHTDAAALARRGLGYAEDLPEPERIALSLELLQLSIDARGRALPPETMSQVVALTSRALDLGLIAPARLGFYLQAYLLWEDGRAADASHFAREAERISRLGDARERVLGLAEAARCAAVLQRDLSEGEAFLLEAEALVKSTDHVPLVLPLARGLMSLHRGELERAETELERARELARRDGDRLEEFSALEARVDLDFRRGHYREALVRSQELVQLAERVREGSEAPYARALLAVCRHALEPGVWGESLAQALQELALVDAKLRRAFVLVRAAQIDASRAEWDSASARAAEALALAKIMDRTSEVALALSVLVHASRALQGEAQSEHVAALVEMLDHPLSVEAREAARRTLASGGSPSERNVKGRKHGEGHRRTSVR